MADTMDMSRFDLQDPPLKHPPVRGRCPSCGSESLFLGSGGYVTCSVIGCKNPGAPTAVLAGPKVATSLNDFAARCHAANAKWWHDTAGLRLARNKGELLMLMVSELSEAMEGERKGLMDDKLPHRRMAEVELADTLIRIFDYAAGFGYDLQGAFEEKMAYNATRVDHTHEARAQAGGKQW